MDGLPTNYDAIVLGTGNNSIPTFNLQLILKKCRIKEKHFIVYKV